MIRNKIILFNPKSANSKHRIPNSILQVGASIHKIYDYVFVDGNLENDPWKTIETYLVSGEFAYFGCTVMPGPQLRQAIPFTKKIKEQKKKKLKTLFNPLKSIYRKAIPRSAKSPDFVAILISKNQKN